MAFLGKITKQKMDVFISNITTEIHSTKRRVEDALLLTQGQTEADYVALGYTAAEATKRKNFFDALNNFFLNRKGKGAVADGITVKNLENESKEWLNFGA